MSLTIRPATPADQDAIWAMLEPVFRAGDTYAIDADVSREAALAYWTGSDRVTYLADEAGVPMGTYYLKSNAAGGGAHVCNCGFVTAPAAAGKGVARQMLAHALTAAKQAGYRAMQFNFVVATNTRAIDIWRRAGFDVVGRLPGAFLHPTRGYVDALVMYKTL